MRTLGGVRFKVCYLCIGISRGEEETFFSWKRALISLKKLLMVYFCKKLAFNRNADHSVEACAIIQNTSYG